MNKPSIFFIMIVAAFIFSSSSFGQTEENAKKTDKSQSAENKEEAKNSGTEDAVKQENNNQEKKQKRNKSSTFTIGEIVVKGQAVANIDQAATSTELTSKDLEARGNRTLDETLSAVPGVQVETHQKGIMRVKIRGFEQDKIAILVDGMPIADVYSTEIDISDISVKNISRIYVNRGVSSALYGTSGAIGSINIVSKKPSKLFAQGGGEYGLYNNYIFDAAVGAPIKNFYTWVTASYQNSDGYVPSRKLTRNEKLRLHNKLIPYYLYGVNFVSINTPGPFDYIFDDGTWNHTDFRKFNTSAKVGYELTDKVEAGVSARLNYGSGRTNTYQPRCYSDYHIETQSWNEPVFQFTLPNELKKSSLVNRSFDWPEKYAATVSPFLKAEYKIFGVKMQGFYSRNHVAQEGYLDHAHFYAKDAPAVLSKSDAYFEPVYDYKTYVSYGVQVYPSVKIASWNRLTTAILWRADEIDARQRAKSSLSSPRVVQNYGLSQYKVNYLKAYFATVAVEDELSIQNHIRITAGISYDAQKFSMHKTRYDDYNYIYADAYIVKRKSMIWGTRDSFNPVAGLVYDAVEDTLTLKTAFSMKTRFPTLGEYEKVSFKMPSSTSSDFEKYWALNYDRGIKPERSYNFNTGFRLNFLERSLEFEADYFCSIVKNRIMKIAGGEEPPVNISRIDTHGLETSISYRKKKVSRIVDIDASLYYTYLYARNRDTSWEETVNMGVFLENTPAHQIICDVRLTFPTRTSFGVWGTALIDQVMYKMRVRPNPNPPAFYSAKYFVPVKLHNQFNLNAKVSQEIWKHFTVYVLFKNILDDYNPDPFNPGPGFMFYGGFEAKL